jgi:hypothetical protein
MNVVSKTLKDWKNVRLLHEIGGFDLCDINNADETGLFLRLELSKVLTF